MSETQSHKISLVVATIIGINAMIGAGIVSMPAILANTAGPAGVLAYGISIAVGLLIGMSLARLSHLYPGKGWSYFYPSQWGGHTIGMISAICYLSGVMIAMGFLVQQSGVWMYGLFPIASPTLISCVLLLLLTILVIAGANVSSIGQYIIATCVIIPLVLTSLACWFNIKPYLLSNFMPYGPESIFKAASLTLFSFLGFESISSLYNSIENPEKNVERATFYSMLIVGLLYTFFAGGVLFSIPLSYFSGGLNDTLASILQRAFPHYTVLPFFVLIGGLFAIIGTLHSMLWSVSTLFKDVLNKSKSRIIKSFIEHNVITMKSIIALTSLCMLSSALLIQAENLIYIAVFLIIVTYVLSIMLLLFEKKEWKSGRNIITIFALAASLSLLYIASLNIYTIMSQVRNY